MLSNSTALRLDAGAPLFGIPRSPQSDSLKAVGLPAWASLQRRKAIDRPRGHDDHGRVTAINPAVDIAPRDIATRRIGRCDGMAAEVVQTIRRERVDIHFRAPMHLLIIVEEGTRVAGESLVEGLPPSSLRQLKRKLTFVPAGHNYHEWNQPSVLSQAIYFYFDPAKFAGLEPDRSNFELAPRLFFEDIALWQTALKLRRLLEAPGANGGLYFEALGVILAHELLRLDMGASKLEPRVRGGLAGWQQRTAVEFIEENVAESISLAKLAELARLSPYHFCRAFKQSFGVPPHRYHTSRRIERAKALLANPAESVTNIGLTLGFSETSSFTTVFRKVTGMTPTAYRRGLG